MSISISTILDTRRIKNEGTYPIKLRVTHDRESQYYPIIYDLSLDDYEKLGASRLNPDLQKIREDLKKIEREAGGIVDEMSIFSFTEFEVNYIAGNSLFIPRKVRQKSIVQTKEEGEFDFTEYFEKFPLIVADLSKLKAGAIAHTYVKSIKSLIQEGRIGTAATYQDCYNSLKKYKGGRDIAFHEIDITYLYSYENWMLGRGISISTVGIKLRVLRSAFNTAIVDKVIKKDAYPFGKRKYQIPTSKNPKRAFDIDEVSKIYYYTPECINEEMARDFWLFIYFGNGINPKDVALLRNKYMIKDFFFFERAKTMRTTRSNPKLITVHITDDMRRIIDKWRNKDQSPNGYLFPIINDDLTAYQKHYTIRRFIFFINRWLKKIEDKLELSGRLNAISARHTYSTIMKLSGASTEFIQEALGHHDKRTTELYLGSFGHDLKKEFSQKLGAFKKAEFV